MESGKSDDRVHDLGSMLCISFFAVKLPQGGVEVWKGLCCPWKPLRLELYSRCVPWPVPCGEKNRRKRSVDVLGMKGLVGGRSWRVSAAGTGWMVHCIAKPRCFSYSFQPAFLSRCKGNVTELFSSLRTEDDMWELYSICKIPVVLTKGFSHVRAIC